MTAGFFWRIHTIALLPSILNILLLPAPCVLGQDTQVWDIEVRLFRDGKCMEQIGEPIMMIEGDTCYANVWANSSFGSFNTEIVKFETPRVLKMTLYDKHCNEHRGASNSKIQVREKKCNVCESFTSGVFAIFDLRFRSNECVGDACSRIIIAKHHYFPGRSCEGLPSYEFLYPLTGECLGWGGTNKTDWGSETFTATTDWKTILQNEYTKCQKCNCPLKKNYGIEVDRCFILDSTAAPQSFKWVLDESGRAPIPTVGASAALRRCKNCQLLLLMAILLIACGCDDAR